MIKVLCLHGCCQTGELFKRYMNPILKMAAKKEYRPIEFIFLDAPFQHPDGGLTWTEPPLNVEQIWCNSDGTRNDALNGKPALSEDWNILRSSFQLLDQAIAESGATVLIGFSQGAFTAVEYINWLRLSGGAGVGAVEISIKRVVAFSGYVFQRDEEIVWDDSIKLMTVYNPMDSVVPSSVRCKGAAIEITHNNKELTIPCREGHVMPTRSAEIRSIVGFIKEDC